MAKNRIGAGDDKKYVMVEGTTKNEKARKISLTKEALDVLKLLRTMGDCVAALPKLERYRIHSGMGELPHYNCLCGLPKNYAS